MFWMTLLLFVGTTIASALLAPRPRDPAGQASGLGDFSFPTAEEGRPIPVFCGTCKLGGPNVVWYGDLAVEPVTQKVGSFLSKKRVTVGYRYSIGMELVFAASGDAQFVELLWDEATPEYTTEDLGDQVLRILLDDPTFFGEADREGGVGGAMDLYLGGQTHGANDYLEDVFGEARPPYRGLVRLVMRQTYIGNSDRMRPLALVLRRLPNSLGLTDGDHDIDGDANPAAWIYELLTDVRWGLGLPPTTIGTDAFLAAGATLAGEGLGVSQIIDSPTSGWDAVQEVLRHIDGVLYTDLRTGLIELALARDDYDAESILQLDTSNVESVELTRGSWAETSNDIRLAYLDRDAGFQRRVIAQQNLAHINASGGRRTETVSFMALSNAATANRICSRTLKTLSYPLAQLVIVANRQARTLRPGAVFRLDWEPLGIKGLVGRVTNFRAGPLQDGRVRFDAVEDIFAIAATAYEPPPASIWEPPDRDALPVVDAELIELPYFSIAALLPDQLGELDDDEALVGVFARQPQGLATGFVLSRRVDAGTFAEQEDPLAFAANATVFEAIPLGADDVEVTLVSGSRLSDVSAGDGALVGDEIMRVVEIDAIAGEAILARGAGDTVPAEHEAGSRIWFFDPADDEAVYAVGGSYEARLLTRVASGDQLDFGAAASEHLELIGRHARPYPPGQFQLNAAYYPTEISGELLVTWAHRDRVAQGEDLFGTAAEDVGPESGTTYRVEVYGEDGETLVQSQAGLPGTLWRLPMVTEVAESGLGRANESLRVVLRAERDGIDSWQAHEWTIDECVGYGMFWGYSYGGGLNDGGSSGLQRDPSYLFSIKGRRVPSIPLDPSPRNLEYRFAAPGYVADIVRQVAMPGGNIMVRDMIWLEKRDISGELVWRQQISAGFGQVLPYAATWDGRFLYVTGTNADSFSDRTLRIDLDNLEGGGAVVIAPPPQRRYGGLAVAGGSVWGTHPSAVVGDGNYGPSTLYELDAATLAELNDFAIPTGGSVDVDTDGTHLFVATQAPGDSRVYRFDLAGNVDGSFVVDDFPVALKVIGDYVWVCTLTGEVPPGEVGGKLRKYDKATGTQQMFERDVVAASGASLLAGAGPSRHYLFADGPYLSVGRYPDGGIEVVDTLRDVVLVQE